MTGQELAYLRLRNQRLSNPSFKQPQEVVHWLGAVQAQDYPGAKWAVATAAEQYGRFLGLSVVLA